MEQQTEILEQSLKSDYASALSLREKMKRLVDNADFKELTSRQQSRLDGLVRSVFSTPTNVDGELGNLHLRGKVAGFEEAMSFVVSLLSGAEATIELLSLQDEQTEETEVSWEGGD